VATAAQEAGRRSLAVQANQVYKDKPQLVFDRALRHFLRDSRFLISSRPDEWVSLRRSINDHINDPEQCQQLKHDTVSLRDALAELEVYGTELASGEKPPFPFVNLALEQTLSTLQVPFRTNLATHNLTLFERAAYRYIASAYSPRRYVIMEGFTFLTPLQHYYIAQCLQKGSMVFLLYPFRSEQNAGFAILLRTYERFQQTGSSVLQLPTTETSPTTNLVWLQQRLFSESPGPGLLPDGTVITRVYSHRHREISACIRRVLELVSAYNAEGVTPSHENIAIVVTDAEVFHSLLQEEAELQDADLKLSVRPRLLLLTPVGRFVLTLYQIWKDGALNIDDEQFEALLTSGWLGAQAQATSERFRTVKAEMFARSRTLAEWQSRLDRLLQRRNSLQPESRQAPAGVSDSAIRLWKDALRQISLLCERLFAAGERSIGEHVRRLNEELDQFAPEDMYKTEREVVQGIQMALAEVSENASLEIKPDEFGDVLVSLVKEYERAADEASKDSLPDQDTIWVTTPQGIDGATCEHVLLLGADNQHMPRPYAEPWPFFHIQVTNHIELQRYFFLGVTRAATKSLYISYAQADEADVYRPSPYLNEVLTILNRSIEEESIPAIPTDQDTPSQTFTVSAERDEYTLDEIAHFRLCPFRYKLERLDGRARRYQDPWQVRFLAQGIWIARILDVLVDKGNAGEVPTSRSEVTSLLNEAIKTTRGIMEADYPAFDSLDWKPIQYQVRVWRDYVRGLYRSQSEKLKKPITFRIQKANASAFTVIDGDRSIVVHAPIRYVLHVGYIQIPITDDRKREEWLLTTHQGAGMSETVAGLTLFAGLGAAIDWWDKALRAAYHRNHTTSRNEARNDEKRQQYIRYQNEVLQGINLLEMGGYPKHIGDHCTYCPVRHTCLGCE
jgi:hypothetical protein